MSIQSSEKIIEGNWDKINGKIKTQWGKLTDKDIDKMNGSYDELLGKIKESYGYSQEEIEKQLNKIINGFDFNKLKNIIQHSVDNMKEKSENVSNYVKENPMKSIFVAMMMGALAAALLKFTKK